MSTPTHHPRFQTGLLALLLLGPLAQGQVSFAQASAPGKNVTEHADRALAAVDLAIVAAESGIMDVSVDAVMRAVAQGPPVSGLDLGGLLSNAPRAGATAIRRGRDPSQLAAANAQTQLAQRLQRLNEVWREKQVDPAVAYTAWKELVFPAERPNEAFVYAVESSTSDRVSYSNVSFDAKRPESIVCGVQALIEWADRAGKLDEVRQVVAERRKLPGGSDTALLIDVLLATLPSSPASQGEAICQELMAKANSLVDNPNAELLFGHVWQLLERLGPSFAGREPLLEAVFTSMKTYPAWSSNRWLQFVAAKHFRESIEQGDAEAFRRMADLWMSRYDGIRANNVDYVASREAEMYGEAARLAFQAGQFQLGADCLRSQSLIVTTQANQTSHAETLLNPTSAVAQQLLAMSPHNRFELLGDLVWNMPTLGLQQCSRFVFRDDVPELFRSPAVGEPAKLPPSRQVAAAGATGVSLLEWAMRDALALGREAEIMARLEELEMKGSDDARIGQLVLALAQGKPLDLSLLIESDADGTPSLKPVLGEGSGVIPLDLVVIQHALEQSELREAAMALLDERLATADDRHQDVPLTWLRKLKFDAQQQAGNPSLTHHDLKHWIVAEEIEQTLYVSGQLPDSMWLQRDGDAWGHEFGPNRSYLMLRYPIEGNVVAEYRCKDGSFEEGAAMFAGLMVEYRGRRRAIRVAGVSNRNETYIDCQDVKLDDFTRSRLEHQGDSLKVYVGESGFIQSLSGGSRAFPFFGFYSCHCSATTFDSLKLADDVNIPRRVEMLSPSLLGWSTWLSGQQLPKVAVLGGDDSADGADQAEVKLDWQCIDGSLESVPPVANDSPDDASNERARAAPPRREALIQYLRPLCDGEEISLEFFYQPEQFSLAPAVGRIAMLLSEPEVHLHWITTDGGGHWTGVAPDNRVIDPAAEQLKPIELKTNDWNGLVVRLADGVVTLRLNGEDVYRRRWEAETGTTFGLFHDPTEYHVRARKIVLSGDWPEKLPEDLFETAARRK